VAAESFAHVLRRRLMGVAYLALIAGLIALSIAIYNKAFTDTVDVKLQTDYTGNSLLVDSDVKERGIIVGSVKAVHSTGDGAVVTLALDPGRVRDIPSNVSAQILPKTLFGEQYVSLVIPPGCDVGQCTPIKANDVIAQDRTKDALEAQRVLGDLLPILKAVKPADLNITLTAVATALNGRGAELGDTLANLDGLLRQFNPHTQKLVDDLNKLSQTADLYNSVAPQLEDMLKNLQVTNTTLVNRQAALDNLLKVATGTSGDFQSFLAANEDRLVRLVGTTDQMYNLLREYSPEDVCLVNGLAHLYDLASSAIQDHQINLSAVFVGKSTIGKYVPGNQPILITGKGPHCFGMPNYQVPFFIPAAFRCLNDGAPLTADPCGAKPSVAQAQELNSVGETALVNSVIARDLGTTVNKVPSGDTVLVAPLLRGNTVTLK
jgi:virulence factor Mce-like protein